MKTVNRFFLALSLLCFLVIGSLTLLLQSQWMKEQVIEVLKSYALQKGVQVSIQEIEGQLPFKWNFHQVKMIFPEEDFAEIDHLELKIAILPLFRGEIQIRSIQANQIYLTYSPHHTPSSSSSLTYLDHSFSISQLNIEQLIVTNCITQEQKSYCLKGQGNWIKDERLSLALSVTSFEGEITLFLKGFPRLNQFSAHCDLSINSSQMGSPFYFIPYDVAGRWSSEINGSWVGLMNALSSFSLEEGGVLTGNFTAQITQIDDPKIAAQTLPVTFSSNFSLQDQTQLQLLSFSLNSPLMDMTGHAKLNPYSFLDEIEAHLSLHQLSLIHPSLQGTASGSFNLNDTQMTGSLVAPQIKINDAMFEKSHLSFSANKDSSMWKGCIDMKTHHPLLGFHAFADVLFEPLSLLSFPYCSVKCPTSWASGALAYDLKKSSFLQGLASFQIEDLSIFSSLLDQSLSGQAGGSLQLQEEGWNGLVIAKHLKINEFISDRIALNFSHFHDLEASQGFLNLSCGPSYAYQLYLDSFNSNLAWNHQIVNYTVCAEGEWKGDFRISSKGALSQMKSQLQIICDEFEGTALDKPFSLQNRCEILLAQDAWKIGALDFSIDQGSLSLSSSFNEDQAILQMKATHFPLDFLTLLSPRYSLTGLSSFDIELEGSPLSLEGYMSGLLEHANIYPAGSETPIQTKGNIQAHFSKDKLQIHSHIVATDHQFCELSATIPFSFNLKPLSLKLSEDKLIAGQCTVEGHIEQLFDFINLGSQRVGGFLSSHLLLSGTLENPILNGSFSLQEGFYENYFVGISLKNSQIKAVAEAHKIILHEMIASDGDQGVAQMTGIIQLNELFSFSMKGAVDQFRLLRLDWLTTTASGPFILEGDIEKALVKGDLKLKHTDITIPEQLPFELPVLDVTLINEPKSHHMKLHYTKPYPIHYDLDLYANHNIFLSGRGVNAELEGKIHLSGQNLAIVLGGKLETKTGSFFCAGKKFKITNGELLFSESLHFLNMTSHIELPDLAVTVHLRGPLRSPQLIFESSPALPTSSILARILFNKDIAELSAPQALQLANTIVTLSGNTGPNVLESIRKGLGIDALSFTSSEDANQVFVQIGKYLTQGVMVTLIQGAESSHVKVEVALKAGFALEAETQENNQGKFSLKWNATY
ncbi:MAG: translocation/assembly module TamB domain-containing protein [Candidatus Rhabdochlamydia sp.]